MKKALLIGINDYPEGNELTGCIEDINSVKAAIERHGDGSPNFGVKMMPNVQTIIGEFKCTVFPIQMYKKV